MNENSESTQHYDQVAPVNGLQMQADGTVAPVAPARPVDPEGEQAVETVRPSLPPHVQVGPVGEELVEAVRAQVDQQRAQLAQPAANVGSDNRPHFQRIIPGNKERPAQEVCGQDGQPWPCDQALGIAAQVQAQEFPVGEIAADGTPQLLTFEEAARAAGVDPVEFAAQVQRYRRQ